MQVSVMFGRMLFVGLRTSDRNIIKKLIHECHVGGIIIYSRNYKTYEEMINLVNFIHQEAEDAGYTILVGIDQEGYRVNRLPKEIHNLKSPYAFHESVDYLKEHGRIIASILASTNINMNLAPVLDIKRFRDDHPIGDRSFGTTPNEVIRNTIPYIKEFTKQGVIPVVKHFPGHGATSINSHFLLPVILRTKRLLEEDIAPFRESIREGCDAVMVGHFIIPRFSLFTPTSFSKKSVQYLRKTLEFDGLIMTDDIDMGPLKLCSKARIIQKAINRGINMIMVKYDDRFFKDYKKLENTKLNQENIDHSLQLIDGLISKYQVTNKVVKNHLNIKEVNQEIDHLNKHAK